MIIPTWGIPPKDIDCSFSSSIQHLTACGFTWLLKHFKNEMTGGKNFERFYNILSVFYTSDWLNGDAAQPHNQRSYVYSALYSLVDHATECAAQNFERSFQIGLILNRILKRFKTFYSKHLKQVHLYLWHIDVFANNASRPQFFSHQWAPLVSINWKITHRWWIWYHWVAKDYEERGAECIVFWGEGSSTTTIRYCVSGSSTGAVKW